MATQKLLSQLDYERLAEFRYHLRRFLQFSERAAAQRGLSPQQHQALLAIKGMSRGKVTIGDLAHRLGIRHNTAVELIDRLIANGLVERRQNSNDRRQVLVELTRRAERILAQMSLAHHDELSKLAPLLRELLEHFERPATLKKRDSRGIDVRDLRLKSAPKEHSPIRARSRSRV
jgi:DNA-binding MarR family transcriptional regulator